MKKIKRYILFPFTFFKKNPLILIVLIILGYGLYNSQKNSSFIKSTKSTLSNATNTLTDKVTNTYNKAVDNIPGNKTDTTLDEKANTSATATRTETNINTNTATTSRQYLLPSYTDSEFYDTSLLFDKDPTTDAVVVTNYCAPPEKKKVIKRVVASGKKNTNIAITNAVIPRSQVKYKINGSQNGNAQRGSDLDSVGVYESFK